MAAGAAAVRVAAAKQVTHGCCKRRAAAPRQAQHIMETRLTHGHPYRTQHGLHRQQWKSIELGTPAAHRRLSLQMNPDCTVSKEHTSAWDAKPRDEDGGLNSPHMIRGRLLEGPFEMHSRCTHILHVPYDAA